MKTQNRRTFHKTTGTVLAAGGCVGLCPSALGANDKIVLALIGGNNQGRGVALSAIKDGAEIKTFCDLDDVVLGKAGADLAKAQGTEAALIVDGSGWKVHSKKGEPGPSAKASGGSHTKNFLECMKSRQRPNADVELGRLGTTICHLGNICTRLQRAVRFDPKTESFGDDTDATALLTKEYRAPFTLPMV
ncbi:MAG TPA: hypothetical protein PK640_19030 [Verrucomicrobiota bacterium]|nr:hypothetical protein [Verrucomicrobiota bacterium]